MHLGLSLGTTKTKAQQCDSVVCTCATNLHSVALSKTCQSLRVALSNLLTGDYRTPAQDHEIKVSIFSIRDLQVLFQRFESTPLSSVDSERVLKQTITVAGTSWQVHHGRNKRMHDMRQADFKVMYNALHCVCDSVCGVFMCVYLQEWAWCACECAYVCECVCGVHVNGCVICM